MKALSLVQTLGIASMWLGYGCSAAEPEAESGPPAPGAAEEPTIDGGGPSTSPAEVARLVVSVPSGVRTTELGGQVTFSVCLARSPRATVLVPIASSVPTEASALPAALTFTAEDWETPRLVTVTGLGDELVDGSVPFTVTVGPAVSDDPGYAGATAAPVALINDDHPLAAYRPADINHLLVTGQSNAVANSSHPPPEELTTAHPTWNNLSFDVGVMTAQACDGNGCRQYETPTDFVPIAEGDVFPLSPTPRETLASTMANQASYLGETVYFPGSQHAGHDVLVSIHGRSGNPYPCLALGSCSWLAGANYVDPFQEGLWQVRDAKAIAESKQKTYAVRGIAVVHGESDHHDYAGLYPRNGTDGTPGAVTSYADALLEWQRDYEREVRAITGQTSAIPLYVLQLQWTERLLNEVSIDQYDAHLRAPGKVVLVAPSYMLPFRPDCLHYTVESQRRIGEYFAKAYATTVFTGQAYEPLRPLAVTRDGNVLTVRYHVPVPPLVLDTETITDPGHYGFTFVDDGATARIESVELAGADALRITLNTAPSGTNMRLLYAVSTAQIACPGPVTGVRGNLRDSDATPSERGGPPLVNWGVGFRMAVP